MSYQRVFDPTIGDWREVQPSDLTGGWTMMVVATPHDGVVLSAGVNTGVHLQSVDCNALRAKSRLGLSVDIATSDTSSTPAGLAQSLTLKWAFHPIEALASVSEFKSFQSLVCSLQIAASVVQRFGVSAPFEPTAQYLYLWIDTTNLPLNPALTVTTRLTAK